MRTHGHFVGSKPSDPRPPGYSAWASMRKRCNNPKTKNYKHYGGRGIRICERWDSFANFIADMGPPPAGTSLDRIDVNGNYEPSNCRWATWEQQHNNRRNNRLITIAGRTQGVTKWARELGVSRSVLLKRLALGWLPFEPTPIGLGEPA
jgi:hypothetical protein